MEANLAVCRAHKCLSGITNIECFCSLTRTFKNHYKQNVFCTKCAGNKSWNASTRRAWDLLVTSMGTMWLRRLQNILWWSREIEISKFGTFWIKTVGRIERMFTEVFWVSSKMTWTIQKMSVEKLRPGGKRSRFWKMEENWSSYKITSTYVQRHFVNRQKIVFMLRSLRRGWYSGLVTSEEIHVLRLGTTEGFLWKWPTSFGNMLTPNFDRFWLPHSDSIRKTPYR